MREAFPVSLDYAAEHLTAAVYGLASSESPLQERLQNAWDEQVQMLWMRPCLTAELLREFRDSWRRYTEPSDDRASTKLRSLERGELEGAIEELVGLLVRTTEARRSPVGSLATLADLA
jgi:hypothetical protein